MIQKIISGGQTGADIGGIDAAIDCHIPCGGYLTKGTVKKCLFFLNTLPFILHELNYS
jgi:hypothetical protein